MNFRRLNLNLLVALDVLLEEQNVTRAAERLHLSPSATSSALGRLRDYFKDDLLTQVGRKMVRTPLGEVMVARVRDCLLHIESTLDARPQFDPAVAVRTFRIVMSDYVSTVLMPAALRLIEAEAPSVTIEMLSAVTRPQDSLERSEVDFLILPTQFIREPHPSEVLFTDDFVCVLWSGNPLVGSEISPEQFQTLGHVIARVGTERPPTVDQVFFERTERRRRVEVIATTFTAVPHLLIGTRRIATLQRRLALAYTGALPLRIVPSPVTMPTLVEAIQWHRYQDLDPGRIWMHDLLRRAAAEGAPVDADPLSIKPSAEVR
jgi:LysR family nod box-dependent transcriptional activator